MIKYITSTILAILIAIFASNSTDYSFLFSNSETQGLSNIGYAPFNLTSPKFNCRAFRKSLAPLNEIHISFLYNTFGNDFSCLKKLLKDERLKTLQIHLINEPGHRNNRLGDYEFLKNVGSVQRYDSLLRRSDPKLKAKYVKYTNRLRVFLENNLQSHTDLIINPGLESNLTNKAGKILVSYTRELFPTARIVWNPFIPHPKKRSATNADLLEGHNLNPKINAPCIYNLDGTDVSYPNRPALGEPEHTDDQSKNWVESGRPLRQLLEKYANVCEIAFVWTAESNGLDYKSKRFVDPRNRNHNVSLKKYRTIMKDIVFMHKKGKIHPSVHEYTEEELLPEKSCDKVYSNFEDGYKKGRLLKQSEFRERGGVLILPNDANLVKIVYGKTVVDRYIKIGSYKDGRKLFRSNKSPITYPFNVYLTYKTNNKKICYKIKNPRIRID